MKNKCNKIVCFASQCTKLLESLCPTHHPVVKLRWKQKEDRIVIELMFKDHEKQN